MIVKVVRAPVNEKMMRLKKGDSVTLGGLCLTAPADGVYLINTTNTLEVAYDSNKRKMV